MKDCDKKPIQGAAVLWAGGIFLILAIMTGGTAAQQVSDLEQTAKISSDPGSTGSNPSDPETAGRMDPAPAKPENQSRPGALGQKTPDSRMTAAKITAIRMKGEKDSEEWIEIFLTGYYVPEISATDSGPPRLVCDFYDVRIDRDFPRVIETNGKLVQRIRIGIHIEPSRKTRVVLDLSPSLDYEVEQFFFEADNLYALKIRKKS